MSRPPRLATRLVRWLLGERLSEDVIVDLAAEFEERLRDGGPRAARRWYWRQVWWTVVPAIRLRLAGPDQDAGSRHAGPAGRPFLPTVLEGALADARLAVQHVRHHPGAALGTVAILGLGIAASTAVFSILSSVLLEPLPYHAPDRIALVRVDRPDAPDHPLLTGVEYAAVRDASSVAEAAVVVAGLTLRMDTEEGSRSVTAGGVGVDLFRVLGVPPALGRHFSDEDLGSGAGVVMVTWDFWKSELAGEPGALGRTISLGDRPYTVVGVLPRDFDLFVGRDARGSEDASVFLPVPVSLGDSRFSTFRTLVRLADDVEYETAEEELAVAAARLVRAHPETLGADGRRYRLVPLHDDVVADARPAILGLLVAVVLVALIACMNAAGLLVARGTIREREYAVRSALGAGRGRLMTQSLVESAVLSLVAAALGIALGTVFLQALLAYAPVDLPRVDAVALDGRALALSGLLAALVTAGFGLLPALHAARTDPQEVLREGGPRHTSTTAPHALVTGQIAVSVVLLLGSGLLVRTVDNLRSVPLGFAPENLHTAKLDAPQPGEGAAYWQFFREAVERLEERPGISGATAISRTPLAEQSDAEVVPYARTTADLADDDRRADLRWMLPNAFEVMGVPLVEGRTFTSEEVEEQRPVVVIDERMSERLWPDASPLGRDLFIPRTYGGDPERATVVGVVAHQRLATLRDEGRPQAFRPASHTDWAFMTIAMRSSLPSVEVFRSIRSLADEMGARNLHGEAAMEAIVRESSASTIVATATVAGLAVIAALSSLLGLYSLLAFLGARGRREMALRIALGARPSAITRKHVGLGLRLTAAGLVVGSAVAALLAGVVESTLFGVQPFDRATWALVLSLFLAVAIAASYGPARRAATVDPMEALRSE